MKKLSKNNTILLSVIGLLVIASSFIISHFVQFSDWMNGFLIGSGIGMLSLIIGKFKVPN